MKTSIQFYIFVVCFILSTLHSFTLYANTQSSDSFHICYFSLNNEKEFTEMEKFTEKLNEHSSHPISVGEYMTKGGSPEESFKKMIDENAPCDGLVISGHHTGSFGGKRASGSLSVGFLEKISCDEKYSDWFKNIQALWLQGCRTLGTGEIVSDQQSDQQEEVSADHHTLRVGNVLDEDHLEQSLADLDMEFSATLDQDNPLSSRYLRVFPMATVFGWTKTAPGERAGSQYSIPFHIAHIARLNNKEDQFPTSKPIDETLDPASAAQYAVSLINLLNRTEKDNECEDSSINAWKRHGTVEDQDTGLGFLNPDLNAFPALIRGNNEILGKARLLDCLLNNSEDEELLKAIDDILKDPELIRYTFNSLLEKLKTLKKSEPELHKKIVDRLKSSSEMNQFLAQKLQSPSLGILRKIDYFAFYEEIYGKSDKIRAALLDQSIKILKTSGSSTSYDVRDYKITLLRSLNKHGYLSHPKGISVLEQGMKDSDEDVREVTVKAAGKIGEPALPILEQGMQDSDEDVREVTVKAAGEIGEPALPVLEQGMQDSDSSVRFQVVVVAGEIGEPALHLVEQGLQDSNKHVRWRAVETAGEIGEPALHLVEQGMKDSGEYTRRQAVEAAGEIGEPALHLVEQGMKDSGEYVRMKAVIAAGKIGEPALPVVEQGMKDEDADVRVEAVRAAGKIGEPALPLIESKGLPVLEQALQDSDRYTRMAAVEVAGEIGEPALHLVEQALQDSDEYVRWDAVETAGKIGEPALPILEQALEHSDRSVRVVAVRAAGEIGEPALPLIESKGLPVLEQALQDSVGDIRLAAFEAAKEIGEPALPMLRKLLEEEEAPRDRERIERAIRQINEKAQNQ